MQPSSYVGFANRPFKSTRRGKCSLSFVVVITTFVVCCWGCLSNTIFAFEGGKPQLELLAAPLLQPRCSNTPAAAVSPKHHTRFNSYSKEAAISKIRNRWVRGSRKERQMKSRATVIDADDSRQKLELETGACVAFRKYSPEDVRKRVFSGPLGLFRVSARFLQMAWEASSFLGGLALDQSQGDYDNPEVVRNRASHLRETLARLGPAFVKAGQVLANRPDIVREDYMNELGKLQDDVPPFRSDQAFQIIEESLGRPLDEVFSEISPRPIASASLGQVYKARLRSNGDLVAVKVQRPGVEPNLYRDLYIFRSLAGLINGWSSRQLGDPFVKIPKPYPELSGPQVVTMEWINGTRCTRTGQIQDMGQVDEFIRHGNIFALDDGRIAYVDFGNVAEISESNKEILIDAVVHAVNEDYKEMAGDFVKLGFLAPGTDVKPIEPALEKIWKDSAVQTLENFNFRTVTGKFNELVYEYPIRIPERYALVIRSLLTQEGICLSLKPDFKFLEVAYPYVAKRLLTDSRLRTRLLEILYKVLTFDRELRTQLVDAFTEGDRLAIPEVRSLLEVLRGSGAVNTTRIINEIPSVSREILREWSTRILTS
eukprot:jgi/Bigna1/126028/aug1.1_g736